MNRYKIGNVNLGGIENRSIACSNGVLLTPKGAFNYKSVDVTEKNVTGEKFDLIDAENFRVIKFFERYEGESYEFFLESLSI